MMEHHIQALRSRFQVSTNKVIDLSASEIIAVQIEPKIISYFTSLQLHVLPLEDYLGMGSGKVHVTTDYFAWLLDYVFVSVAKFYSVAVSYTHLRAHET